LALKLATEIKTMPCCPDSSPNFTEFLQALCLLVVNAVLPARTQQQLDVGRKPVREDLFCPRCCDDQEMSMNCSQQQRRRSSV